MSGRPDPDDITAPRDPAEYRPKPLMGVGFWAMIALSVLCVLAGAGVATFGSKLLPARLQREAPLEVQKTDAATLVPTASPVSVTGPAAAPNAPDVDRLSARVTALEGQDRSAAEAAAAALAAAAVLDASRGSGPFAEELAGLRAAAPDLPEFATLARLAETGAPSASALAASYPEYAARAASAARAPGEGAGLGARIGYALTRIVSIRRVAETSGTAADAILARAEVQVEDGDIARAVRTLDQLPPSAREAMAPWRGRAERRAEIDRQAAGLRIRALHALAPAPGIGP